MLSYQNSPNFYILTIWLVGELTFNKNNTIYRLNIENIVRLNLWPDICLNLKMFYTFFNKKNSLFSISNEQEKQTKKLDFICMP